MQQKRNIILLGTAGELFGSEFKLAVNTPAEAFSALSVLRKGFKKFMIENVGLYTMIVDKKELSDGDKSFNLKHPENHDFIITPVFNGSAKNGFERFLTGTVMMVASVATVWATDGTAGWKGLEAATAETFTGNGFAAFAAHAGAMLAIGGVVQMLSPTVKLGGMTAADDSASDMFNGAVNTISQGAAKPILYGRMKIGSATISEGLSNKDVPAS